MGLEDHIIPISADATRSLPFARDYFNLLFCMDAYHYFGHTEDMLPSLLPCVKYGGHIAAAMPGLKDDFPGSAPEKMWSHWVENMNFFTLNWWREPWSKASGIELRDCREGAWHE